jgi:hypothetical protein
MKNLSVRKAILEYLKLNPGSKAGKISAGTYKPVNQVYTNLGVLLKKGALKRKNHAYWLVDSVPMTALNPEQPTVQIHMPKPHVTTKVENERKAMREQDLLHIKISELKNQIADLEEQLQDISVKYYDALAVINYLEKFFGIKK